MKPIEEWLTTLASHGIAVKAEQGQLKIKAPPGVITPDIKNELTARKQEIVDFLAMLTPQAKLTSIPKRREGEDAPLSFAQERLWFLHQYAPHGGAYNMVRRVMWQGPLSVSAWHDGFQMVATRQRVLRTAYPDREGRPRQIDVPPPMPVTVDLTGLSATRAGALANDLTAQEVQCVFKLSSRAPIRVTLLRFAADQHQMLVNIHHIAADEWSVGLLLLQWRDAYLGALTNTNTNPEPLPLDYRDFAAWQRQQWHDTHKPQGLHFWQQHLAGAPPLSMPPTDPLLPQASQTGTVPVQIEAEILDDLRTQAQAANTSLFAVFLTAQAWVWARFAGQKQLVFGVPMAGRIRSELEDLLGLFVNTLPVHLRLSDHQCFRSCLRQCGQHLTGVQEHQTMPLEHLLEHLDIERQRNRHPLFQAVCLLQNTPERAIDLPLLNSKSLPVHRGQPKFELAFNLSPLAQRVQGQLEFDMRYYRLDTAKRIARAWQLVLAAVAQDPQHTLATVPMMDDHERENLLRNWNRTTMALPTPTLCHHGLLPNFARFAEGVALIDGHGEVRLQYAELGRQAKAVATWLRQSGCTAEMPIGLWAHRGVDTAVALVGILMAGATVVPIEPTLPATRQQSMLQLANVQCLLHPDPEPPIVSTTVTCAHIAAITPTEPLEHGATIDPQQLAYILFTSGSTGHPKAVGISHAAIANRMAWAQRRYPMTPEDRFLQLASWGFDIALWELFAAWAGGGTTVLMPQGWQGEPEALLWRLQHHQITALHLVPSLMATLLETEKSALQRGFASVQRLFCGGERLHLSDAKHWQSTISAALFHFYGPTEAAINTTAWMVPDRGPAHAVSLGSPIDNTLVRVLDEHLQPQPVGVVGAVYLGGIALARGYVGQPKRTAAAFIPDPFAAVMDTPQPGTRLYRTGDRGAMTADGTLRFHGRADDQIKLRGIRIEPGEITAVLHTHPLVKDAAVIAEQKADQVQLIAYVANGVQTLDSDTLRQYAANHLPAAMVPSTVMIMDHLPRNTNGKLDRKRLPNPVYKPRQRPQVPPRTALEARVVAIWENILDRRPIGVHDNFFSHGGNSLLAVRVVAHLRQVLQRPVAVRTLFEAPTPASLTTALAPREGHRNETKLKAHALPDAPPLLHAQQRLWLLDRLDGTGAAYNLAQALRCHGPLDVHALERAYHAIIDRHAVLRTHYPDMDGAPIQRILSVWQPPIEVIHANTCALPTVQFWLAQIANHPFQPSLRPPLRCVLIRLNVNEHILVFCVHHIAADGWSMALFSQGLADHYRPGEIIGQVDDAQDLQIAHVAMWERRRLRQPLLRQQLAYWRRQLDNVPALLTWPLDHPRPQRLQYQGARCELSVPENTANRLRDLAKQREVSIFMVMQAAFAALLARYTHQDDICIGTPTAGRTQPEMESLIGCFVNTLVLRHRIPADTNFLSLLDSTRNITLDALDNQDVPFERIVDSLQPERALSHTPLFQVMFALQNTPTHSLTMPGLQVEPIQPDRVTAKFDMLLAMDGMGRIGTIEYRTSLFDKTWIETFSRRFIRLLTEVATHPHVALSQLNLLSRAEQRTLTRWQTAPPMDEIFQAPWQRINTIAQAVPDRIALRWQGHAMSYKTLLDCSEKIAAMLAKKGAPKRVGIAMTRRPAMVAAMLAVWRIGAAYVPLDPDYPEARITYMLQDAAVPLLLVDADRAHTAPSVCDHMPVSPQPSSVPTRRDTWPLPQPQNLSHIIYTSGSSGRAKGVAVTVGATSARLTWATNHFPKKAWDGVLAATSICFDLSIFELFAPLASGGCLVLARNVASLPDLPDRHSVRLINTVPSAMSALLETQALPTDLRYVNLAGEPLPASLAQRLSHLDLYNLYGPSEDTTYSTVAGIGAEELAMPPIGRPLPGTAVKIVDHQGQPTLPGLPGELWLKGVGLARGYVARPGLTAERFVPADHGKRAYRTGDLVRFNTQGQLLYLGRIDDQVKVRGYRIEPREIEAVLAAMPSVREAAVLVNRENARPRLVAAVNLDSHTSIEACQQQLSQQLPTYMVPDRMVVIDAWPRLPNGKTDRQTLARQIPPRETTAGSAPLQDEVEALMVDIWARLLNRPAVGRDDNFFDLGGDSIMAIRLAAALRHKGFRLEPHRLFEAQTIARLRPLLQTATENRVPAAGPFPLTPIMSWFFDQQLPHPHHFNQALIFSVPPDLADDRFKAAAKMLTSHHDALRLRFTGTPPQPRIQPSTEPSFKVYRVQNEAEHQQHADLAQASLNIHSGPIWSMTLLRRDDSTAHLLLCIHHLAVDAVSWTRLLADLQMMLEQDSPPEHLPPIAGGSLRQWAFDWLAKVPQREQAVCDYWLAQPLGEHQWPVASPKTIARGETRHHFQLSVAETQRLRTGVHHAYGTRLEDVLLTAVALTAGQTCAADRLAIGLERHGREGGDVAETVGWFTALVPFSLPLRGDAATLVKQIKEQLRQLPDGGASFGWVRDRGSDIARQQLQALPKPQVVFNYLGTLDNPGGASGPLRPCDAPRGARSHGDNPPPHLLDIGALIHNQQLHIHMRYATAHISTDWVHQFAAALQVVLRELIQAWHQHPAQSRTPSDFPLAHLDQTQLDQLCNSYGVPEDLYPPTPLQAGLLVHTRVQRGHKRQDYFEQLRCTLRGPLDANRFQWAWQQVAQRHAAFRTAFIWQGLPEALQRVVHQCDLPWQTLDWRDKPTEHRQQAWQQLLQRDRERGFDLTQAPLMRWFLVHWDNQSYRLVWSHHHVLLDGWSIGLVLQEVMQYYSTETHLPTPPPFRNYVAWLDARDTSAARRFWREQLADIDEPTQLALPRPRADADGHRAQRLQRVLRPSIAQPLGQWARQHRLTLNTLCQAAWALTVCAYSGKDDVLFGTTISGRPADLPGVSRMVGLFIQTQPARFRLDTHLALLTWLQEAQSLQRDRERYSTLPPAEVKAMTAIPRDLDPFDTLFIFENLPRTQQHQDRSIHIEDVRIFEQTHFPLTLMIRPGENLVVDCLYHGERFSERAVTSLLDSWTRLLQILPNHVTEPVAAIDWLSDQQRRQLLEQWGTGSQASPAKDLLHPLLGQRNANPDRVAYQGRHGNADPVLLTYGALVKQGMGWAHELRHRGVRAETPVGLSADRNPHAIAALLGIIMAGGAYLPLDPTYPKERLATMIWDAHATIILADKAARRRLPHVSPTDASQTTTGMVLGSPQIIDIHQPPAPKAIPLDPVHAQRMLYILFTSGSTGRPKGIAGTHANTMNRLQWMWRVEPFVASDCMVLKTSLNFVDSVWELFGGLLQGIPATIVDNETGRNPRALLGRLRETHVTRMALVPSLLQALLEDHPNLATHLPQLRTWITSGEVLTDNLAARFQTAMPGRRLLNLYGSSEVAADVTAGLIEDGAVHLGHPIDGASLRILDEQMRLLPPGVVGHLHVSGAPLARGYLNRSDLTAEAFVPDPWGQSQRLYRTGDMAWFDHQGQLHFAGRSDTQVKVRGQRLELAEVESALQSHPAIEEAVVLLLADPRGDRLLGAFVTPSTTPVPEHEVFTLLADHLPPHALPNLLIWREDFPRTPNGKLDRRTLAATAVDFTASRDLAIDENAVVQADGNTSLEHSLLVIWRHLLQRPDLGPHDHFFRSGGHSLSAARAVARAEEALSLTIPLRLLFEHPTVIDFAAALRKLIPHVGQATTQQKTAAQLPAQLSHAQTRLWFLAQLDQHSGAYNIPFNLLLRGTLDVEAFDRALTAVVDKHAPLRTTFIEQAGQPQPATHTERLDDTLLVDLRDLREQSRHAHANRLGARIADQPMDLNQGPLLRVCLSRLSVDQHHCAIVMHHIIADGWSAGVFAQDLAFAYEQTLNTGKPACQTLTYTYRHWVAEQQARNQGDRLDRQLAFWEQHLAHAAPCHDLPTDRPRPAKQTTNGATLRFRLPDTTRRGMQTLADTCDATPFMVMQAAFAALLIRKGHRPDVILGSASANRDRPETEALIGLMVNTLVMRIDGSGNPPFTELVNRVRRDSLAVLEHRNTPFEAIVDRLKPTRSRAFTPLFQIMFDVRNLPMDALAVKGLHLEPLAVQRTTAKFDISLFMTAQGEGGLLEYNPDLFDQASMTALCDQYATLMAQATQQPTTQLNDLPLLSPATQRDLLTRWSRATDGIPSFVAIPTLLQDLAQLRPDAPAILLEDRVLTRADVLGRAAVLAAHLQSMGAGPEVRVAVCLPRSLDAIVTLTAVMLSGAAYVPLDPRQPTQRLAWLLNAAAVGMVVTNDASFEALPAYETGFMPVLSVDDPSVWQEDTGALDQPTYHQDQAAYVLFTSGSSGRPKGVCISHGGLSRYVRWTAAHYPPSGHVGAVPCFGNLAFDATITALWTPWCAGLPIAIVASDDVDNLWRVFRKQGPFAFAKLTPAHLDALLTADPNASLPCQRLVVGGEALSSHLVARLYQRQTDIHIINEYGPTETVVGSVAATITDASEPIPIGRPIAGARIYVVDQRGRQVPPGTPGELWLGGASLARGYEGQAALTAGSFVPNPFEDEMGGRLYRTGDSVRFHHNGKLLFMGRLDRQIKHRGYRIEPAEIERAMREHVGIQTALVRQHTDRILAYGNQYTDQDARGNDPDESTSALAASQSQQIRRDLAEILPAYMVPDQVFLLPAFPLTANGKIDENALPTAPFADTTTTRLDTPNARRLAILWAETLGIDVPGVGTPSVATPSVATPGADAHFFHQGGHSLLAVQLIARIRDEWGIALPIQHLFDHPRLGDLAESLTNDIVDHAVTLPPLQAMDPIDHQNYRAMGGYPLTAAQQRLWFLAQLEGNSATYHIPAVLDLVGALDVSALARAFDAVAQRHEPLRSRFVEHRETPLVTIDGEAPVPLLVDLQQGRPNRAALASISHQLAAYPFQLDRQPPWRVVILRLTPRKHRLVVVIHHLIGDGLSAGILVGEMVHLYHRALGRRIAALPKLPVTYSDVAHWQQTEAVQAVFSHQLTYWQKKLAGLPPLLDLPTDRPRPTVQQFEGAAVHFSFEAVTLLRQRAVEATTTPFAVLQTLWATILARYTDTTDIVMGMPSAGRPDPAMQALIGLFINTLILRADLEGQPNLTEAIQRQAGVHAAALTHGDVPFERLVEHLQPERSTAYNPIFQVLIDLQPPGDPPPTIQGLVSTPAASGLNTAKVDLALSFTDKGEHITGLLQYDRALFDDVSMQAMVNRFCHLAKQALQAPHIPLIRWSLINEADRDRLLFQWNQTEREFVGSPYITDWLTAWQKRTPDAVALGEVAAGESSGLRLSFATMMNRCKGYAANLQAQGVQCDDVVAVMADRPLDMCLGMVAVLRSGAAYLPLDPSFPAERIATILTTTGTRHVLSQPKWASQWTDAPQSLVVMDNTTVTKPYLRPPQDHAQLAYVMVTSGSTGLPKPVAISHRALANRLDWARHHFPFSRNSLFLQTAAHSFDIAIWESLAGMLAGGQTLCLPPQAHGDPASITQAIVAETISDVHMVPSLLRTILDEIPMTRLTGLKRLYCGGEALNHRLVDDAKAALTGSLVQFYGPTETTINVTAGEPQSGQRVDLGDPIANTRLYVVDRALQPVPLGLPGELVIAGEALARGYVGQPAQTARVFIPDPFAPSGGGRLYRTGDRVRRTQAGELLFLGRIDHQIKLRGVRIEPGEIERLLINHPHVEDALVMAHDHQGDSLLVAYVTPTDQACNGQALRAFLRGKVPPYMVPTQVVILNHWPLLPNGKLNRRGLPAPSLEQGLDTSPPRSDREAAVAAIWAEVLERDAVGVHANFFDLGGHSLLATRMISRLRSRLNLTAPLSLIFREPTVARLCAQLDDLPQVNNPWQAPDETLAADEEEFAL